MQKAPEHCSGAFLCFFHAGGDGGEQLRCLKGLGDVGVHAGILQEKLGDLLIQGTVLHQQDVQAVGVCRGGCCRSGSTVWVPLEGEGDHEGAALIQLRVFHAVGRKDRVKRN